MNAYINPSVNDFILNQRKINSMFRKETGLYRTHLEILSYANTIISFNAYNVQQQFVEMNLQQVRLGIRKLVSVGALEVLFSGARNRPAVYLISYKGKRLLNTYSQAWLPKTAGNKSLDLSSDILA